MATALKVVGSQDGASAFRTLVSTDLPVLDPANIPIATSSLLGGVKPDGTVITVSGAGAITVPDASNTVKGVVKSDNLTIVSTAGVLALAAVILPATTGAPVDTPAAGTVRFDYVNFILYAYTGSAWKSVALA